MRLLPAPLKIEDYDGFNEHDIMFPRLNFGNFLKKLFEEVEDPLTVILDSPWGTGKSTFIGMWCGHMRKLGFPVIYFDAFKHDYTEDAFAAIAGEVIAQAETYYIDSTKCDDGSELISQEEKNKIKSQASDFFDVAKRFGKVLLKTGGKGLIQKGAEKFMGEEAVEEIKDSYGELAADLFKDAQGAGVKEAERYLEELIETKIVGRNQQKVVFKDFKYELSQLAKQLTKPAKKLALKHGTSQSNVLPEQRPLIFVIDELDRCKPTFALAILEMVKHFFSQDNIHFLLVTHVKQLESSVKHAYGINGQENEYLQKFHSLLLTLPAQDASAAYGTWLLGELTIDPASGTEGEKELWKAVPLLTIDRPGMTLRALEKVAAHIKLLKISLPDQMVASFPYVVLMLPFLMVCDRELYLKIINNKGMIGDVLSFWGWSFDPTKDLSISTQWNALFFNTSDKDKKRYCKEREALKRSLEFSPVIPI